MFLEQFKITPHNFHLFDASLIVKGEDAFSFLQSQTTNDLKKLSNGEFQFNSLLDGSGKLVSIFMLCRRSDEEFYILLDARILQSTIDRIEKYHISEDFSVQKCLQHSILSTHAKKSSSELSFVGQYYFENDQIIISSDSLKYNLSDRKLFDVLYGIQSLDDNLIGQIINNTIFDELAVDYKKGCFLGQETVSKIHSNRGAAFKPALLIIDGEYEFESNKSIHEASRKIGMIISSVAYEKKTYVCLSLIRDKRVDLSELNFEIDGYKLCGVVRYYPFIKYKSSEIANELYDVAVDFFQAGDELKAIEYFEKAICFNPLFEDAYESLGVLHGRREQYDMAIKLMETLKEINPKCMMAFTNLSLFHMKIGNIKTAEKYKSDATFLNFEILGNEADRKREIEKVKEKKLAEQKRRESMFLQVIDMDPSDAMANNGMGEIELERGQYSLAVNYFKSAIEENAKYSVAYLGLGKALKEAGNIVQAKEILTKGILVAGKNGDLMPANEMQSLLLSLAPC